MQAHAVQDRLAAVAGGEWQVRALNASGFCNTWSATGGQKLFIKSAAGPAAEMLEAEADGLRALQGSGTIRVPGIVMFERHAGTSLLAMEWLDLVTPDAGFGERFGHALGALHAAPPPFDRFGWPRGNFVGATPQVNTPDADWLAFHAERLRSMERRLEGARSSVIDEVIATMPALFNDGYTPRASLIHGDLWSGNWGMLADGTPVVYDPSVSCSDAEAELAMMELFSSPPEGFFEAYREAAGLHEGYARRRPLYQLYHLLNHAVLFGGAYFQQATRCARGLIAAAQAA